MHKKYKVLNIVGEGAYGIVYKCQNKETNEIVALKKFKETSDEQVIKTMKRELEMLKKIKHENIVEFKEYFIYKKNLYLVFEFVEKNLLELLQESPNGLSQSTIKYIIYQLIKAIKYLHSKNIIHRDIKPENLLINSDLKLKLCDFGFARNIKLNSDNNNISIMTDYVATRWYRAPELLLTEGIYGPEIDFWAIGCIMGELIDGNPLFPGEDDYDQLCCIIKIMGKLPFWLYQFYLKNPIFEGKELLNEDGEGIYNRYFGKVSLVAIKFMEMLLQVDPYKRFNGDMALRHKYFEGYLDNQFNEDLDIVLEENNNFGNRNLGNLNQENCNFKDFDISKNNISCNDILNNDNNNINIIYNKNKNINNLNKKNIEIITKEQKVKNDNNRNYNSYNNQMKKKDDKNIYEERKDYQSQRIEYKTSNNLNKIIINNSNSKIEITQSKSPKNLNNTSNDYIYKNNNTKSTMNLKIINNNLTNNKININKNQNKSQNNLIYKKNNHYYNNTSQLVNSKPKIISLMPNGQLTGFQTYLKQKNDKYNFAINTLFKNNINLKQNNYNQINNFPIIKEKEEFKQDIFYNHKKIKLKKISSQNQKLSMFYLGNFINEEKSKDKKFKTESDKFINYNKFDYISHNGKTKITFKLPQLFQFFENMGGNNNNKKIKELKFQKINNYN